MNQGGNGYEFFLPAVTAKVVGSLAFAGIYLYYYGGGDTISYAVSAQAVVQLLFHSPAHALDILFFGYKPESVSYFTNETGYPYHYILAEGDTFSVVKVVVIFLLFSFNSYILSTVLISLVSLVGPWYLFKALLLKYPDGKIFLAIALFFMPSVVFWGSGISKDTITFSAACYLVALFSRESLRSIISFWPLLALALSCTLLISIKPYILLALMPGMIYISFYGQVLKVQNLILRIAIVPVFTIISVFLAISAYLMLGEYLGEYSADRILDKALITQEDLTREAYGTNSFDIGEIDKSFVGVLSKFPIATISGLYRPAIFEAANVVMLFSALENLALSLLTIAAVVKSPIRNIKRVLSERFLVFSLIFVLIMGFSLGLTTANFGALVRFKIPLVPFLVSTLLLLVWNIPERR